MDDMVINLTNLSLIFETKNIDEYVTKDRTMNTTIQLAAFNYHNCDQNKP